MKTNLDTLFGVLPPEVAGDVALAIAIFVIAGIGVRLIGYTRRTGLVFTIAARILAHTMLGVAVIAVSILIAVLVARRLLAAIG